MQPGKEHTLILLSCSNHKESGGRRYQTEDRQIFRNLMVKEAEELIRKRKEIFSYLHNDREKRIFATGTKDGYRDERGANPELMLVGPDLGYGSSSSQQIYLPAYKRYKSRFFNGLLKAAPNFWENLHQYSVEILFVSAAYGLLLWDEPIQNYDCNFLVQIQSESREKGRKLEEFWKDTLTSTLCNFLCEAKKKNPIVMIYDLLSDESYQNAIRWHLVAKEGVEIRHRMLKESNDSKILYSLATILGSDFDRFLPSTSNSFDVGSWNTTNAGIPIRFDPVVFGDLECMKLSLTDRYP